MSPEAVKDPEVREAYKKALIENGRRLAAGSEQDELRQVLQQFKPAAFKYFGDNYASDEGLAELKRLFDQFEIAAIDRTPILDAIAQRRAVVPKAQIVGQKPSVEMSKPTTQ
jgi:hypothetical protein